MTTGLLPYEEKHWLEYGMDYAVSEPNGNIGGKVTILKAIPPEAKQIVIRRVTPKTQEIDLHNGARLPAELIETIGDKATMEIQEIADQSLTKDDRNEILQAMNEAIKEATTAVWESLNEDLQEAIENEALARMERDTELTGIVIDQQQTITALQTQQHEQQYLIEYLIQLIESNTGPLNGTFPFMIEGGYYLVTENGDYLVAA